MAEIPEANTVLDHSDRTNPSPGRALFLYSVLFFVSGFPALLYQIVWQRSLFTLYGVNIESVTAIVTIFIFGLGLGSLAGGKLSTKPGLPVLRTFALIEISIGIFGAISLTLFRHVAAWTAGASTFKTVIITFGLLLLPTLLMGSTLPLMVAHFVRRMGNVGEAVGTLYAVNTFGSAAACFAAATFVMRSLGESGSVMLAALINLAVGVTALTAHFTAPPVIEPRQTDMTLEDRHRTMSFPKAVTASAAAGFIALAYEIIWYRYYSFTSGGRAPVFALLLGYYLAGIAFGASAVRDFCRNRVRTDPRGALRAAAQLVLYANIVALLLGPLIAHAVRYISLLLTLPAVFLGAALLGAVFPLISHAVISPHDRAGAKVSYLYLANIIGSCAGSLIVGFWLLDRWSTRTVSVGLLLGGCVVAVLLAAAGRPSARYRRSFAAALCIAAVAALTSRPLFSRMYEHMLYKDQYSTERFFVQVIENRQGVIAVAPENVVYGGGVYDGHFSTGLVDDPNNVFRAYAIGALHRRPKNVLMIGLSSGSWAQVIANHPEVDTLTIVEINPGYLDLIPHYPAVASLLRNHKVHITIDDGRRWLTRYRAEKFDLIVMNTSFHWRAHTANLLSLNFLDLIRSHLKPGGLHYYNTTGSPEAIVTGCTRFPYALRVGNFLAVSDSPILVNIERWRALIAAYTIDGRSVFDLGNPDHRKRFEELALLFDRVDRGDGNDFMHEIETRPRMLARLRASRLITDDNMGTEWMQSMRRF